MRIFMPFIIFICMITVLCFPIHGQTMAQKQQPVPSTNHFILMDEPTGRVLLADNEDEQVSIASITKLMTAVVALEYGNLDDRIEISEQALQTSGSSIYLEIGEEMTLEDLLYGLMLRSGNDAAKVIAEHIGGSEEGFVYLMNETAAYLGMTNSSFRNPHGLDEEHHYSSAYDIAILMQYAMQDDSFKEITSTESYHSEQRTYPWRNKNKLLTEKYEYTTGGKTGFTSKAGRTLVTTAEKNQKELIAVTLNASDDWNDHIALYEWGFSEYDTVLLEKQGERSFVTEESITRGYVPYDVIFPLLQQEQDNLAKQVEIYRYPKDDRLGLMTYYLNDREALLEVPIFEIVNTDISTKQKWLNKWNQLFKVNSND